MACHGFSTTEYQRLLSSNGGCSHLDILNLLLMTTRPGHHQTIDSRCVSKTNVGHRFTLNSTRYGTNFTRHNGIPDVCRYTSAQTVSIAFRNSTSQSKHCHPTDFSMQSPVGNCAPWLGLYCATPCPVCRHHPHLLVQ